MTFQPVEAADLRWHRMGDLASGSKRGGGFVFGGFVFGDTYLVYGSDADDRSMIWTSTDGRTWDSEVLGDLVEACPGSGLYPSKVISSGATDGQRIVLAGIQFQVGGAGCNTSSAVSWVSPDGHSWDRSLPLGTGDPKAVWAANGAWEAAVWNGTGEPGTLWRSADGRTWSHLPTPATAPETTVGWHGDRDGTRLMFMHNEGTGNSSEIDGLLSGESRLRRSSDGVAWEDVDWDFNGGHATTELWLLAQRSPDGSTPWLLVADHGEEPPVVWRSMDLVQWQSGTFPMAHISSAAVTRFGFVAKGEALGCGAGGECEEGPPVQLLSTDGLAWTALPSSITTDFILDGPAGVLAIGVGDAGEVWALGS